jgi:hypothetical protein
MILILWMISSKECNVEWPMEVYGLTLQYFFWLTQFIKHPLEMWSTRTCKPYMNVGTKFNASEKLILTYIMKVYEWIWKPKNNITKKEHSN